MQVPGGSLRECQATRHGAIGLGTGTGLRQIGKTACPVLTHGRTHRRRSVGAVERHAAEVMVLAG